jgi:hypothetical protein
MHEKKSLKSILSKDYIKRFSSDSGCIYFSGLPNNEPMVKGAPFVMNKELKLHRRLKMIRKG